ncbi:EamA family transporter [Paenibacillus sp. J2TS4]|uniref:EamA family transporter n=1 Tax=Paenibacillus sp. J2TS4 TaxID=2807194 RepID=UPI001B050B4A|nr:EamA family transporter [Paenibacillus sp. J2TS4]GIP33954.1 hypothetical protein J2TS4_31640 [Paenibacillus sp. J2TS4]
MWLVYASLACLFFGMRGILYQWTSQKPLDRNLLLFGVYLSGTLIAVGLSLILQPEWSPAVWIGLLMGVFSFTANAAMYKGFAVGKASLIAILAGLPPVVVVIMAYALWGEALTWGQGAAFLVIISGILLIRYSSDLSLSNLKGVQWGIITLISFGITDVASKQAMLWGGETIPTLVVMYATGMVLFFVSWLLSLKKTRAQAAQASNEETVPSWSFSKTILWGLVVGISNISGMLLILPAFKYGVTGLVSAVVAMNVLIILFYARLFLKEKFNKQETAGIVFAFCGMILLRLIG